MNSQTKVTCLRKPKSTKGCSANGRRYGTYIFLISHIIFKYNSNLTAYMETKTVQKRKLWCAIEKRQRREGLG
jgi:hypothetical protein